MSSAPLSTAISYPPTAVIYPPIAVDSIIAYSVPGCNGRRFIWPFRTAVVGWPSLSMWTVQNMRPSNHIPLTTYLGCVAQSLLPPSHHHLGFLSPPVSKEAQCSCQCNEHAALQCNIPHKEQRDLQFQLRTSSPSTNHERVIASYFNQTKRSTSRFTSSPCNLYNNGSLLPQSHTEPYP